jgi:hypothetical protein
MAYGAPGVEKIKTLIICIYDTSTSSTCLNRLMLMATLVAYPGRVALVR